MKERQYYLAFAAFPGIGPKTFAKLLSYFGSAKEAWSAPLAVWREAGLGEVLPRKFEAFRKTFSVEAYSLELQRKSIWFVTLEDEAYPERLKNSVNPPYVLFGKGDRDAFSAEKTIGIVGTRKITAYGRDVTELLARDLVSSGFVIISGLALGVDAVAHAMAIADGGKTVAVLGSGVDVCHPSTNQSLYNSILQKDGAVVSEYPPGTVPTRGSFPSRNRIIAGLSEAIIVTEGAEDSGALITASDAFASGRKVFAVPGPITSSLSKGPLKLLQKGATLVTSTEDILQELGIENHESRKKKQAIRGETEEEQKIIEYLQHEPMSVDELIKKTGFDPASVGMLLSMMEVKGMIRMLEQEYALNC